MAPRNCVTVRQAIMKLLQLTAVCAFLFCAVSTDAVVPVYREIQTSMVFGPSLVSGEWSTIMESGISCELHIGLAVARQVTVGMQAGLGSYANRLDSIGYYGTPIGDGAWTRYTGGTYCEYSFGTRRFVPVLGATFGVHGVHIPYESIFDGSNGQGNYGFGYGINGGVRYRSVRRWGLDLRIGAENSPAMFSGWFYQVGIGISAFL
jgi:hypothetical protein